MNIKRYCPDKDCPSWKRIRKGNDRRGRYLGTSQIGAYARFYCPECKKWWTWNKQGLEEAGTMILEDSL